MTCRPAGFPALAGSWRRGRLIALTSALGLFSPVPVAAESPNLTRLEILDSSEPSRPFEVSRLRGRTTVLYIWGDWCRACARSTPEILALAERFPEVGFVFINTDDPARPLKAPLRPNLIEARVDRAFFGQAVMRKKGFRFSELGLVFGVPAYFVVDPQGRIVNTGNGSRYPATLSSLLQSYASSPVKG